jgi:hypothetical protein
VIPSHRYARPSGDAKGKTAFSSNSKLISPSRLDRIQNVQLRQIKTAPAEPTQNASLPPSPPIGLPE